MVSLPATATPEWHGWPDEAKRKYLAGLQGLKRRMWRRKARLAQLPPDHDWTILVLTGGRGSGKSWAGAHVFMEEIMGDPDRTEGEWAIVAPTFADARDKCVESDESGLLMALGTSVNEVKAGRSAVVETWNRSIGELILKDGTRIYIDGADDGAYRIQGYNLRGCWADEIGLWKQWKAAWDESLGFALRKGRSRRIATGTPKRNMPARALVRRLLKDPKVVSRRLRTADNLHNLSQAFIESQVAPFEGTQLGEQELEGKLLDDAEGALWRRSWFDSPGFRVDPDRIPRGGWQRAPVVGVDPADGNEDGAEHAYTVVALGRDHKLHVLENDGVRVSPYAFASDCIDAALRHQALIVVEKNHGGQWLVTVFERAMRDRGVRVPLKVVSAAQGKRTRAEPVAALYEQGHFRHVGVFAELEDQMCVAGGTLVATERGPRPIECVRAGERVWTRAGLRRVQWAGQTGVKETVVLRTAAADLMLTPEHPVFVRGRGFVPASSSDPGNSVALCPFPSAWTAAYSSRTQGPAAASRAPSEHGGAAPMTAASDASASSSKGSPTTVTTTATSRPAASTAGDCSIASSGKLRTGRSPRAGTFTTWTRTAATTLSATCWLSALLLTVASMVRLARPRSRSSGAVFGGASSGRNASPRSSPAESVARRSSRRRCASPTTARPGVAIERWAAVERIEPGPRVPVFNLTVEGQPEFYANGLLVHNCNFTGASGEVSPDRLDSAVWAASEFTGLTFGPPADPWGEEGAVPYRADKPGTDGAVPYSQPEGAVAWS